MCLNGNRKASRARRLNGGEVEWRLGEEGPAVRTPTRASLGIALGAALASCLVAAAATALARGLVADSLASQAAERLTTLLRAREL